MNAIPAQGRRRRAAGHGGAGAGRRAQPAGAGGGRAAPASTRSIASAARRRWARSPMAPPPSPPSTRSSGRATPMSRPPSAASSARVGIDMIAGPSEILVVADRQQRPAWIAADLLSQAEHDTAAQSILVTDDEAFAEAVARRSSAARGAAAPCDRRRELARPWRDHHGARWDEAVPLVDRLAPEHLELARRMMPKASRRVRNRRRHLSRPLHARSGRRLCRRPQPRAADGAQRALFLGPWRPRFHEAHLAACAATPRACAPSARPR